MSPVNTDTSFIENRAPNVAVQFRDRVHKIPDGEAYRYPPATAQPWTSLTWKETGDRVEKLAAGPARARASRPSSGSASPPAPASSGSWPTSR